MSEAWCDHCDLPLATCTHGMAVPPPSPAARKPAPAPRLSRAKARSVDDDTAKTPRGVVVRHAARRRTPPAMLRPLIVAMLEEHGGSLDSETVLVDLEERAADLLTDEDREIGPQGEPRWHLAMRKERAALTSEGLMRPADGRAVWELAR